MTGKIQLAVALALISLSLMVSLPGSAQGLNNLPGICDIQSLGEGVVTADAEAPHIGDSTPAQDLRSQTLVKPSQPPAPKPQETQAVQSYNYPSDPNFPKLYIFLYSKEYNASPLRQSLASRSGRTKYYLNISPIILKYAKLYNLDPHLVKGVIRAESGFYNYAVSCHGAQGLMQLIPSTGAYMGATDLFNPEQNIAAGCKYLKEMLNTFGDVATALAAYNAGPGTVSRSGAPAHSLRYARLVLQYARE